MQNNNVCSSENIEVVGRWSTANASFVNSCTECEIDVLAAVSVKGTVFWNVMLCNVVVIAVSEEPLAAISKLVIAILTCTPV